jgi:hypothetical protein
MRRAVSPEGGREGEIKKATKGSLLSGSEALKFSKGGELPINDYRFGVWVGQFLIGITPFFNTFLKTFFKYIF